LAVRVSERGFVVVFEPAAMISHPRSIPFNTLCDPSPPHSWRISEHPNASFSVLLALLLGGWSTATAQETGRKLALVIGNSKYLSAGALPNGVRDAAASMPS